MAQGRSAGLSAAQDARLFKKCLQTGVAKGKDADIARAPVAGHRIGVGLITPAAGCATNPIVANLAMVYQ